MFAWYRLPRLAAARDGHSIPLLPSPRRHLGAEAAGILVRHLSLGHFHPDLARVPSRAQHLFPSRERGRFRADSGRQVDDQRSFRARTHARAGVLSSRPRPAATPNLRPSSCWVEVVDPSPRFPLRGGCRASLPLAFPNPMKLCSSCRLPSSLKSPQAVFAPETCSDRGQFACLLSVLLFPVGVPISDVKIYAPIRPSPGIGFPALPPCRPPRAGMTAEPAFRCPEVREAPSARPSSEEI